MLPPELTRQNKPESVIPMLLCESLIFIFFVLCQYYLAYQVAGSCLYFQTKNNTFCNNDLTEMQ